MKDFQLIIVNDGLINNSENIFEKYVVIDNKIKYFLENKGVSVAKSFSLKTSTNFKYIIFIDSNNLDEKNFYEKVMQYIDDNNLDIRYMYYQLYDRRKKFYKFKEKESIHYEKYLLKYLRVVVYRSDTLFKREVVLDLLLVKDLHYYVMCSISGSHTFSRKLDVLKANKLRYLSKKRKYSFCYRITYSVI